MSTATNLRLVVTKAVLWFFVGVATVVGIARFLLGLGPTTALTDQTPWGLWIGFDVLSGVALAAGGFVIAATVHVFRLRRYEALVRPAILTAFLGYLAVVMGLSVDVGRPWNLWRMTVNWQAHSPLFEVGWCVMLYLTVLALEFAPVAFEGLGWLRPSRWLRRVTLGLVIAGIGLSTLHQSSLGTLFLLTPYRMHPLWYSPILPVLFLVSAIGLGLAMVAVEGLVTSWLYRREAEWALLPGLTRAASVLLALYLALRIGDLLVRGKLALGLDWASALFVFEILLSAVIPLALFTVPVLRRRRGALAGGAALVVIGFVLHRIDVGGLSQLFVTGARYVPALTELAISVGIVSFLGLVFLLFIERFPVWEHAPETETHFAPPLVDPTSGAHFGGPWFSRAHLGALGWVCGAVCGIALLETTMGAGGLPVATPVQPVRSVQVELVTPGKATPRLRLLVGTSNIDDADVLPALLVDGDRSDTGVPFAHLAHQERLGGAKSCVRCHHRNARRDRGTSCGVCHRDMYRVTQTFDHRPHVAALGANASCARCHPAGHAHARSRAATCETADCHAAETHAQAALKRQHRLPAGQAVGYAAALHGLCLECHRQTDARAGQERLSRCTWCHPAPTGRPAPEARAVQIAER